MKFKLPDGMIEATRLTREGRLGEATSLIQRLLRGKGGPSSGPAALNVPVIDLVAESSEPVTKEKPASTSARTAFAGGAGVKAPAKQKRNPAAEQAPASAKQKPATTVPASAGEAQFKGFSFTNSFGMRAYKLYVPSSYSGKPLPLIVMLHGCTQSADDFAAGTAMNALAESKGFLVAYPEQSSAANPNRCWNWFNPRDQQREQGEPSIIAGITRAIMEEYAVDARKVYVAGLSAGGAAAAVLGGTYPDLYAAVGVHSGLPAGSAQDLGSALAAMRNPKDPSGLPHGAVLHGRGRFVPTIVFHGDKDTTVHPRNGQHVISQSRTKEAGDLRAVSQHGHVAEGHTYTRTEHRDRAGRTLLEMWTIHGAGHAWSGGKKEGSYTDPKGPDASTEMVRFFLEHARSA